MRLVRVTSLSVALLPFLAGGPALAAGFMVRENSAESLGMIYAGDASRADEAATVFNNPAGMMHLAGPEVELSAAVVFPSVHFSGSATAAGTIPIPGNQGGEAGQITGIPNFYAVFGLSDNLRAGLAVTAPFGDTINYKSMFVGRYQGIKTLALSADINPNIAWRINDTVSVAAGVSAQWLKLEQSAAIPQFLIFQNPAAPDASFLFNGTNWGFGYNLGLLLEPNTTTRLGFTWRSGVDHKQSGSLDFTGANPALGLTNGSATAAGLDLPGTAAVSFTHDWSPEFTGSAELQYNTWSSFKQVTIDSATSPLISAGALPEQLDDQRRRHLPRHQSTLASRRRRLGSDAGHGPIQNRGCARFRPVHDWGRRRVCSRAGCDYRSWLRPLFRVNKSTDRRKCEFD